MGDWFDLGARVRGVTAKIDWFLATVFELLANVLFGIGYLLLKEEDRDPMRIAMAMKDTNAKDPNVQRSRSVVKIFRWSLLVCVLAIAFGVPIYQIGWENGRTVYVQDEYLYFHAKKSCANPALAPVHSSDVFYAIEHGKTPCPECVEKKY